MLYTQYIFNLLQVNESSVEHVIKNLKTWIETNPVWVLKDNRHIIDLPVKNEENLELRFCATKNKTSISIPRFAYLFDNLRIRGLDFHYKYYDFEGNTQYGWHNHFWTDKMQDNYRKQNKDFEHIPAERQIDYVLKQWNIKYIEQLRLELK